MLRIVLLVCFIMCMFLWLLTLLAAAPGLVTYSPWLAWFAVALLAAFVAAGGVAPLVVSRK